jgi:hypothetical protein
MTSPASLTCSGCGSPLDPTPGERFIHCKFCGRSHDTWTIPAVEPPRVEVAPRFYEVPRVHVPPATDPSPPPESSELSIPKSNIPVVVLALVAVAFVAGLVALPLALRAKRPSGAAGSFLSAPAGTGKLNARSVPTDVRFSIDGVDAGASLWSKGVESGRPHTLRVVAGERYEPTEMTVTVGKGETRDLGTIKLKVLKGAVKLDGRLPVNGRVALVSESGTVDVPALPATVDVETSKPWTVKASGHGYRDFEQPLSFDDGQVQQRVFVRFRAIQSAPDGSDGCIPKAVTERVVKSQQSKIRYCFAHSMGMMQKDIQVDENGKVTWPVPQSVHGDSGSADFIDECIAEGLARWPFPKAKIPTNFSMSFQFNSDQSVQVAVDY